MLHTSTPVIPTTAAVVEATPAIPTLEVKTSPELLTTKTGLINENIGDLCSSQDVNLKKKRETSARKIYLATYFFLMKRTVAIIKPCVYLMVQVLSVN